MTATLDRWLLFAGFLVFWLILSLVVGTSALPTPLDTAIRLAADLAKPTFWPHVAETGKAVLLALAVSITGGVTLGLLLGLNRFIGQVTEPILVALYSLPKVTFYPLILLVFGIGFSAKVAFGAIHGIVPVTLFTVGAVRGLSPILLRTAASLRLSPRQTAWNVVVPALLPEIMAGIRVGFSLTLLGTLVGELFASQAGLGYLLKRAMSAADSSAILSVTAFIFIVALAANQALIMLSARVSGSARNAASSGVFRGRVARSRAG